MMDAQTEISIVKPVFTARKKTQLTAIKSLLVSVIYNEVFCFT